MPFPQFEHAPFSPTPDLAERFGSFTSSSISSSSGGGGGAASAMASTIAAAVAVAAGTTAAAGDGFFCQNKSAAESPASTTTPAIYGRGLEPWPGMREKRGGSDSGAAAVWDKSDPKRKLGALGCPQCGVYEVCIDTAQGQLATQIVDQIAKKTKNVTAVSP